MPVQIEKKEIVTVKDHRGIVLTKGDPIIIRVGTEDVVCRYSGIRNGYFVTETLEDAKENKYRQGSIVTVTRISGIAGYTAEPEVMEAEAAEEQED